MCIKKTVASTLGALSLGVATIASASTSMQHPSMVRFTDTFKSNHDLTVKCQASGLINPMKPGAELCDTGNVNKGYFVSGDGTAAFYFMLDGSPICQLTFQMTASGGEDIIRVEPLVKDQKQLSWCHYSAKYYPKHDGSDVNRLRSLTIGPHN